MALFGMIQFGPLSRPSTHNRQLTSRLTYPYWESEVAQGAREIFGLLPHEMVSAKVCEIYYNLSPHSIDMLFCSCTYSSLASPHWIYQARSNTDKLALSGTRYQAWSSPKYNVNLHVISGQVLQHVYQIYRQIYIEYITDLSHFKP